MSLAADRRTGVASASNDTTFVSKDGVRFMALLRGECEVGVLTLDRSGLRSSRFFNISV